MVSIHILGYNSRPYLRACLQSALEQTHRPTEIIFSDNDSHDGSVEFVREHFPTIQVLANRQNLGYCGGHNQGIRASSGDFILTLNPDVALTPTYVSHIVEALQQAPDVGSATGRLRRCKLEPESEQLVPIEPPILDSTGLFLDRWRRGLDRDRGKPDRGRNGPSELIFAPSGAAAVYRRSMLESIAEGGQYFDETFFVGYEDVDIAWRAQRAGWRCLYVPQALAYHVRGWGHVVRRSQKGEHRFRAAHSVKNRYLTMLKNESMAEFFHDLPWILGFNLAELLALILLQPRALVGLLWLLRAAPEVLRRRRHSQVTGHPALLEPWFGCV
jgi:GT2 family glycosyltransferase